MKKIYIFLFVIQVVLFITVNAICKENSAPGDFSRRIEKSLWRIVLSDSRSCPNDLVVVRQKEGDIYRFLLRNKTGEPQRIKEIILLDIEHKLPAQTPFYGEGYTMLSQTSGTLSNPADIDPLTDRGHYRLPEPQGMRTVYGMMYINGPDGNTVLLGFSSCKRFAGKFNVNSQRIEAVIAAENLSIRAGEEWQLEELVIIEGKQREKILEKFAERININHPRLPWPKVPTGWCSWYCFGANVTAGNVLDNLSAFRAKMPGQIRYIQIDDGYQRRMGDWLESNDRFEGGVQKIIEQIREAGFEPAIWVAPFIASKESRLFNEHRDWFIKDTNGLPLSSGDVTFGGWRQGPWYMLDGTHPEACKYLEKVFRTMSDEWGVRYFKLDANVWGAMPFGSRFDANATSVEAYRRGMAAIRRGAGNSFILGGNHPMWLSLGEIHGCRTSMDVGRSWKAWTRAARENLLRNWQNNRLWWNDPDCLVISKADNENELMFHLTATYASGGLVLSGDDVAKYSSKQWDWLKRAASNPGNAAVFEDDKLEVGVIEQGNKKLCVFLNWGQEPVQRSMPLDSKVHVSDFWTGEDMGVHSGQFVLQNMPARSGRLFIFEPVGSR